MNIEKTAVNEPAAMFTGLVTAYVSYLKDEIRQDPKKTAALQISEEKLSNRIVQGVKRRMVAEGYVVEEPAPNMFGRVILHVSEPQPDPREVAIERFRSYAWNNIMWACARAHVEFPHRIDVYSGAQPDHIRVVLRELRSCGWKAYYRPGARYVTIDCPPESFTS